MLGVNNQTIVEYHQYLDKQEAFLDAYIDTGSDHELFIASYIHGHFSVVAANLLIAMNDPKNEAHSILLWQEQTMFMLTQSIDQAISNNELSDKDASDVLIMREALFNQ